MAIMFPAEINDKVNEAEKKMFRELKKGLNENIVCLHNYKIQERETDFIVAIPSVGIAVIEVKAWIGNRIKRIKDQDHIEFINKGKLKTEKSPLNQCRGYTYKLIDKIKHNLGKNLKVVPIVCFPFMNEHVYESKQLNKIIPRESTILFNDLDDRVSIEEIIKKKVNKYYLKEFDSLDREEYLKFCSLFIDNNILKEKFCNDEIEKVKMMRLFKKRDYSILSAFELIIEEYEDFLGEIFEKWIVGTKIVLLIRKIENKNVIMEYMSKRINQEINYLTGHEEFNTIDKNGDLKTKIFNFEIHCLDEDICIKYSSFRIVDGRGIEDYIDELKIIDKKSTFNLNQYELEHASKNNNIMVKAGAGTGKTYSMISRIAYLYYINNYNYSELAERILMITFTNEATDNMKKRLKEYFKNMALLTEKKEYISIIESISNMNISTIDSLMKKIIQRYSKYLGVGQSIKITTEEYEIKKVIEEELDKRIKESKYRDILKKITKYEIIQLIKEFNKLLDKKNIRTDEFEKLVGVVENVELFELIRDITKITKERVIESDRENNTMHLNNVGYHLSDLIKSLNEIDMNSTEKIYKDYVFIDEFQDTDDITISFINSFYKLECCNFKLFVVGDVKQSIYRFRGADDEAFMKLKGYINDWQRSLVSGDEFFTINKNYRSSIQVLRELDSIFGSWNCVKNYKNILKYSDKDKLIGVFDGETNGKKIKKVFCEENTFDKKLVDFIKEKIDSIENCEEKKTIALLVRKNEEIEALRNIFKETDYEVETHKIDNLFLTEPAIDLYRLVQGLLYHKNAKYLYSLSKSNYAPTISNTEVYKNRSNREHILQLFNGNKIIGNWNNTEDAFDENTILGSLKTQTILRVLRKIISECKPWNRFSVRFKESEREEKKLWYKRNLDLLIETIINRSSSDYITINSLEKYLYLMIFTKQHADERSIDKQQKKVRIICSTVHKSKGLEYDYVIIPYTGRSTQSRSINEMVKINDEIYFKLTVKRNSDDNESNIVIKSNKFYEKTKIEKEELLKEEARILYVALTRAKDSITWFCDSKDEKNITWKDMLDN